MSCVDETASLKRDEVTRLIDLYKAGDDSAGWRIVQSMEGWMTTLISRDVHGEVLQDARSELSIVLLKSLKRYDCTKSSISHFVNIIWQRRKCRILAKYLPPMDESDASESCEFDIETLGCCDDDEYCTVAQELHDTTEVDEVAKLAFCMKSRKYNRAEIVERITESFPSYFAVHAIKSRERHAHVGQLINDVATVLGRRFDFQPIEKIKTPLVRGRQSKRDLHEESMIACRLNNASDEQFRAVARLLLTPSSINGLVRAFRRHGVLISHHGIESLLKRFEIERRIKAVVGGESMDTHLAEILSLRHYRPKKVRPAKEPKPNPVLRLLDDVTWERIVELLPVDHLKLPGMRNRISAIVQRQTDQLTWKQATTLAGGGNLRTLHEILSDIGVLAQIMELTTTGQSSSGPAVTRVSLTAADSRN